MDTVHPEWLQRNLGPLANVGGRFWNQTQYVSPPSFTGEARIKVFGNPGLPAQHRGPLYPDARTFLRAKSMNQSSGYPLPLAYALDVAGLSAWGTKGIAQSLPTVPEVSIAQTLGELREGLPSVPLKSMLKKRKLSSAGNEYLNFQFGIMPIARDLDNYAKVIRNYGNIKKELHKRSDTDMRRRRLLVNETDTSVTVTRNQYPQPNAVTSLFTPGDLTVTKTITRRIWFSGAFRYSIRPQAYEWLDQAADFNRIFGVVPTAKTLYELTPWSWLADWFSNGGDVMTNISTLGRDGLYMRYGYVMASFEEKTETSWTGAMNGKKLTTSVVEINSVKQRQSAVPFGFGMTLSDITPSQGAILTSLGLSRLRI